MKIITFIAIWCVCCMWSFGQNLTLKVKNVNNMEGHLQIMVFINDSTFKEDNPEKIFRYSKDKVKNGEVDIRLTLPSGIYGIVLLDDKNDSRKMEYNMLGIPKEGVGFSGYYHKGLMRPDFSKFAFEIHKKAVQKEILIRNFSLRN